MKSERYRYLAGHVGPLQATANVGFILRIIGIYLYYEKEQTHESSKY